MLVLVLWVLVRVVFCVVLSVVGVVGFGVAVGVVGGVGAVGVGVDTESSIIFASIC